MSSRGCGRNWDIKTGGSFIKKYSEINIFWNVSKRLKLHD
jgi:hypothetical protein